MIAFISGTVASYGVDNVVVDQNGVGWQISYPHVENIKLNQQVKIHTYMHITENDIALYGFESIEEKRLFLNLISVKGLGPKTAMNMLAKAGYEKIVAAVEQGDVAALKKMPGIGAKSASQIVLDLKGKLVHSEAKEKAPAPAAYPQEITDAMEGLKNLGYKASEISFLGNIFMEKPGLSSSEYLKIGLKHLLNPHVGG